MRCEHGHDRQHLVDYWWQNDSTAGASWCDGIPGGERIENITKEVRPWIPELQGLGLFVKTGSAWNDGHWVLEGDDDE